jgi:hypothetical protein
MRFGFLAGPHFFCVWWESVFPGVSAKKSVFGVVICGEVVVDCVVNRGALTVVFWRLKMCHFLDFYFSFFVRRLG